MLRSGNDSPAWRKSRRLSGAEADELIDGYQAGASQLSAITTTVGDSIQGDRLSLALWRARLRFTGTPAEPLRRLTVFFGAQLPAALYRVRWLTLAVAAATVDRVGGLRGVALQRPAGVRDPRPPRRAAHARRAGVRQLLLRVTPRPGFTGQVWTNNAWLAAQCIMFGITGVWVPYVLLQNAAGPRRRRRPS